MASGFHLPPFLKVILILILFSILAFRLFTPQEDPEYLPFSFDSPLSDDHDSESYTIVVNTFRRNNCLERALHHWTSCNAKEIHVVWPDPDSKVPEFFQDMPSRVIVNEMPGTNLTYRFYPFDFKTDAIFQVDDDYVYDCWFIDKAFELWKKDRDSMVGFGPRKLHTNGGYWNVEPTRFGMYNTLFVTKGAFLHRRFYKMYFRPEIRKLRDYVDLNTTAEDILMSCIYADAMPEKDPIAVLIPKVNRSVYWDCGHKLSRNFQKKEQIRRQIANNFYDYYGYPFRPDFYGFYNLTTQRFEPNHTGAFI